MICQMITACCMHKDISVTPEGSPVLFCSESLCTPTLTDLAFMTKDHLLLILKFI